MPILFLLVLSLVLSACDRADDGTVPAGSTSESAQVSRPAFYARRVVFLANSGGTPTTASFDFTVHVDTGEVRRTARAWGGDGAHLTTLLDTAWVMEPMREPWRVVPHGPLRIAVGDEGELEALRIANDTLPFRLYFGRALGEWAPVPDARLLVRRAELTRDGPPISGAMMDLRIGSAGLPAEPADGVEAYLTDGRTVYVVVLGDASGGRRAWFQQRQQREAWEDVVVEAFEFQARSGTAPAAADPSGAADSVATAWRLASPDETLRGEIRWLSTDSEPPPATGVMTVDGWVEVRGQRHSVFGIVRRVSE